MVRWLQWSSIDLENGLGGVEVHARTLARELRALGHETAFSRDRDALLTQDWDVIQTHGSAVPLLSALKPHSSKRRPIRVHTLHGTTLGRMAACGEWTWVGGYLAALREYRGVVESDLVLTVNPGLSLVSFARKLGRKVVDCGNGWDSALDEEELPQPLLGKLPAPGSYWVFVGRGDDPVKAVDRLLEAKNQLPDLKLVAAPGAGFAEDSGVLQTGPLTPAQLHRLYDHGAGLVLCSHYEGNSLVVLEALARGTPVISTPVGGALIYRGQLEGLVVADSSEPAAIAAAIAQAADLPRDAKARAVRAAHNRNVIPTWRKVAETSLAAVTDFMKERA